ncbi:response regulator transcription factor [Kribbella sp. NPDC051620]|uniref:response regulator transcription factor n=1 Tax=Kribbella sp. NPDC051620 TaxID=3364120 RepID=UPI0037AC71F4
MSMEQMVSAGQRNDHVPEGMCQVYELGVLDRPPVLSHRQLAVGELMATGAKDAAIARQLGVSLRTVRSEISALVAALGATSRFQAGCLLVRRFG